MPTSIRNFLDAVLTEFASRRSRSRLVRSKKLIALACSVIAAIAICNGSEAFGQIRQPSPKTQPVSNAYVPPNAAPINGAAPPNQNPSQQLEQGDAAPPDQPQANIVKPDFLPLSPEKQRDVDTILSYWQQATAKIQRYESKFKRWQYDTTERADKDEYITAANGIIRYMAPDKGMFRIDKLTFTTKNPKTNVLELLEREGQFGEWWVCDGEQVHVYDRTLKQVSQYELPADIRGKEVFNSPLPFVFGVDAQRMQQRFWVNYVTELAINKTPVLQLEVYPKTQADAMNYHHVTVFLDKREYMPVAIEIADINWTLDAPNREFFEFYERKANWNFVDKVLDSLQFSKEFIPTVPAGYKIQKHPAAVPADMPVSQAQQPDQANPKR